MGRAIIPRAREVAEAQVRAELQEEWRRTRDAPREELRAEERAALTQGGLDLAAMPAASPAVERTIARYAALLAGSRSVAEVATLLGVDESRVRQRLAARTLYGIKRGRDWLLPAFQFADAGEVPRLGAVLPRLQPDLHPVAVANWFTQPTPDLLLDGEPLSPRDWLRSGGTPGPVAVLAAAL